MTNMRPSLLERAAEVYDFDFAPPAAAPIAPAPEREARRVRPVPAAPVAEPQALRRGAPVSTPVRHERVGLDREALAASGLIMPDAPGGAQAEELRLIKRRLLAAVDARVEQGDERARVVLLASGRPGEGKTFMALNLALSIAAEPERNVLLVDGDNAKPELLARLGLDDDRAGFVDALADPRLDPEALVIDTDIDGLSLLAAGRKERNVPELLASGRTDELLARLLAADPRRIVLIDSSPVLAASTTGVLAAHVGQTLVVVKADQTLEADLKETLDLLSVCDNLSLVLNGAAFQVASRRFAQYEEYR
jgi:protein-tyrosine kinase